MEPTAQSLARTYSDREYPDPWEKVLDYRRVQAYAAEHPDAGRTKVGNALDLPPSRVRGWIGDGMPDAVRGIQTAIDHGWLDPEPDSEIAAALVRLLAHVLGGGSINQLWVPALSVGRTVTAAELEAAIEDVGLQSNRRHEQGDSRATEVVPSDDGSVLGRCLVAMGVPKGTKRDLEHLPAVIDAVPQSVRRDVARILIQHRGTDLEQKATTTLQGDRPRSYRRDLAALISDVTGENATAGARSVIVSADAVRALGLESVTHD